MNPSFWNLNTRVQALNGFPENCYVKRDDELSCAISGTKLRKYASLIPTLIRQQVKRLLVIAGPQSNNLLAAVQLARENKMQITAFLIKPWKPIYQGNYIFSRLFIEDEDIVWIERKNWPAVETLVSEYAKNLKENYFILKEGASVAEAMPGAMTLGDDIVRNEKELNIGFQHIFIDAGTGFSAIGLIKSLTEKKHSAYIHVLLLADNEALFYEKLSKWMEVKPKSVKCFYPQTAKAFGSVNQQIKNEIRKIAKEEGILLDPVYSAKLFYEARHKIINEHLQGNKLLIHSGGLLSLCGFDICKMFQIGD
ncbi:pyridoxal-phosphate dependent enzyme [Legionella israelensis]|uniref:pyridoxal-phosphate dependent enzyme n=1 Tax=Legionella israelensis TaxID=454 RepID=UPI00117C7765|nr:pyridoxal-phosphate dependent enzyme [Legionella israelensis]QDP72561.1 pyridoxal-phosphate dependent enzyme [Legionella israelensis]